MLSKQHKRYIINNYIIASALINTIINAIVAYSLFADQAQVMMWGEPSLAVDIIVTTVLLTFITTILVHWGASLALTYGRLEPVIATGVGLAILQRLPQSSTARAVCFSIVATVLIAPLVIYTMQLMGLTYFSATAAMLFKVAFALALGALLTPMICLAALSRNHL